VTVSIYVHAIVVGNGTSTNPYRPSLYPPALENTTSLFATGVFCADSLVPHPGIGTVDVFDSVDAGEGHIYGISKFIGAICVATLDLTDEMWPAIRDATNGFLFGQTMPALKATAAERYDATLVEIRDYEPTLASNLDAVGISGAPATIRAYLASTTYEHASSESARSWVVGKLDGSRTDCLPTAWVSGNIVNFAGVMDYWNAYSASGPDTEPRSLARLWTAARTAIVHNGL
jgi:hypothetical protein